MNGVIGMTSLVLETSLTATQKDYLATIHSSGNALLAVINDILDFSKIESGRLEVERHRFDLLSIVEESLDLVAPEAAAKGLVVAYVADDVPSFVVGSPTRIRQVLVNLLSNAVKFTPRGQIAVEVDASEADGEGVVLTFTVRDTGIGVPLDRQGRMFEPFRRVAICDASELQLRSFACLLRGLGHEPVVMNEPEKGADADVVLIGASTAEEAQALIAKLPARMVRRPLIVALPLGVGDVVQLPNRADKPLKRSGLERALAAALGGPRPASSPRPALRPEEPHALRILVAEDHVVNQRVAVFLLERLGYRADLVATGYEAIEALRSRPYDVVLMDLQMPGMDGLEATRRIRSELSNGDVKVIAVTASALESDRQACLDAGMNGHLSKPLIVEELARTLEAIATSLPRRTSEVALDLERLERMDLPLPVLRDIVSTYLRDFDERFAALREAAVSGDRTRSARTAHALAGSSANLGAVLLAAELRAFELDPSHGSATERVAALEALYLGTAAALHGYLGERAARESAAGR